MNIQEAAQSLMIDTSAEPEEQAPPVEGEMEEEENGETPEDDALLDELEAGEESEDAPESGPEDEDEAEEDIPPPPNSWSKEDAEAWKALTPEARAIVQRREAERDRFVAEAGRKSAETRKAVEREAIEAVAQHAEKYAQQLDAALATIMPQRPDERLLASNDPNMVSEYLRQKAVFDNALAQYHAVQREAETARTQAENARKQAQQAALQADAQRLSEQLPEWSDPSAREKLVTELKSIGVELGYPQELIEQAGADDILALNKAREWREKARKLDKIMSKRMANVRAAKSLPKMTRPGAATTRSPQASVEDLSTRIQNFERTRTPEAAAALLLERKR